jgi:hypothetical protein
MKYTTFDEPPLNDAPSYVPGQPSDTPTPPQQEQSFVFNYPANARELKRRQSPLLSWYAGANPPGTIISHGVVTSDNKKA